MTVDRIGLSFPLLGVFVCLSFPPDLTLSFARGLGEGDAGMGWSRALPPATRAGAARGKEVSAPPSAGVLKFGVRILARNPVGKEVSAPPSAWCVLSLAVRTVEPGRKEVSDRTSAPVWTSDFSSLMRNRGREGSFDSSLRSGFVR